MTSETLREDIDAFLRLWGEPNAAELRLWVAALAPLGDQTADILAAWVRQSERRPHPHELLKLRFEAAGVSRMRQTAAEVAGIYGMSLDEIRSRDTQYETVISRHHVMFALRAAGYSLTRIGRFLQRDHTTVANGVRAHEARALEGKSNNAFAI